MNGYVYNLNKEIVVRAPLYSILRSLRYHNGDMWLKCCQKSHLFSSKIFANSLMHSVFLTVRHLPFSITCECCVEFKVKTWQNCCQGFLAKMVWKLAISHFSSVWEGRSVQSFWTRVLPSVCSLDLLFGHNLVSVAVVVFLHSLITHYLRTLQSNLTEITNSRNEAVCFIVCNLDCSDIWWSYMHKINQSFKPIIYKKKSNQNIVI